MSILIRFLSRRVCYQHRTQLRVQRNHQQRNRPMIQPKLHRGVLPKHRAKLLPNHRPNPRPKLPRNHRPRNRPKLQLNHQVKLRRKRLPRHRPQNAKDSWHRVRTSMKPFVKSILPPPIWWWFLKINTTEMTINPMTITMEMITMSIDMRIRNYRIRWRIIQQSNRYLNRITISNSKHGILSYRKDILILSLLV